MTIDDALLSKPREPLPRGPLATQALNLQIADHGIQCLWCLIQHSMLPHDIHDSRKSSWNDMLKCPKIGGISGNILRQTIAGLSHIRPGFLGTPWISSLRGLRHCSQLFQKAGGFLFRRQGHGRRWQLIHLAHMAQTHPVWASNKKNLYKAIGTNQELQVSWQ